jgi:hypothetical protein
MMPGMKRALAIALLPLLLASARADDKPDVQTILDAWKAREKKTESFDFRWWAKHFESSSYHLSQAANIGRPYNSTQAATIPDTTFVAEDRFLMDGRGRIRFDDKSKEWAADKADLVPRSSIDLFDGKIRQIQHYDLESGDSTLILRENKIHSGAYGAVMHPLATVYRPISIGIAGFEAKNLTLANENATVDNKLVLVVDYGNGKVWIDPNKDYLPVRYTIEDKGVTYWRTEITYTRDDDHGWLPQSWTVEALDKSGKIQISEIARVVQFSINKPIADFEFELKLSGGALVYDLINKSEYILRPDGTRSELDPGKFNGHNLQELLKSEPDSK